jgi:hypothetical protein
LDFWRKQKTKSFDLKKISEANFLTKQKTKLLEKSGRIQGKIQQVVFSIGRPKEKERRAGLWNSLGVDWFCNRQGITRV